MAAVETSKAAKPSSDDPKTLAIDSRFMDERRRWLIKVVMVTRYTFRGYFGLSFSNRWGFFLDKNLCKKIREFGYWVDYKSGHYEFEGHKKGVYAAVASRDGHYLFTGSADKSLMVWDLIKKEVIQQWPAHDRQVLDLAFYPGLLVSGSADSTIRTWNPYTQELKKTLVGHSGAVWSVSLNKNGDQIVSGSGDKSVRVWDVRSGDCVKVLEGHSLLVNSALFLGNRTILSGAMDKSMRVWNTKSGRFSEISDDAITKGITQLCINQDGSVVCCLFGEGFAIFEWPKMENIGTFEMEATQGCFHPLNPNVFAVFDRSDHMIKIHDVKKGEILMNIEEREGTDVKHIAFSADGTRLITASLSVFIRVWDVSTVF